MSVYMHDKWPLIYESILPNCKCFVTVYEGFCGHDGLVLALRANSVQQKATIQVVHYTVYRCMASTNYFQKKNRSLEAGICRYFQKKNRSLEAEIFLGPTG